MGLMDKLKKQSTVKDTATLATSKFFGVTDMVPTDVPMVNVALSGDADGGVTPGLTVLAGPSKHFKTSFALLMAGAYLKQKKDAVASFFKFSNSLVVPKSMIYYPKAIRLKLSTLAPGQVEATY